MATKQRRFDMRLESEQKRLLDKAAAIRGLSLTDFVRSHLILTAREIVEKDQTTALSARDSEIFLRILDSDAEPNLALKRALKRARARRA